MTAWNEPRTWWCAPLALAALLLSAASPLRAQQAVSEGERHLALRAYYLADSFSSHSEAAIGVDTVTTVTYDGKPGGGLDVEYLLTPWLGVDLAASQTHIDAVEVTRTPVGPRFSVTGKIQMRTFTLGLYGHVLRVEHLDLYIGPTVGLVEMTAGGFRPSDTEPGFGATLGLDVPLGTSGFALSGVGRVFGSRFPDQLRHASHFRDNYTYGGGLSYRW